MAALFDRDAVRRFTDARVLPVARSRAARTIGTAALANVERCRRPVAALRDETATAQTDHLVGDGSRVADLSAAALLVPLAGVAQAALQRPEPMPRSTAQLLETCRPHPAMPRALHVFEAHDCKRSTTTVARNLGINAALPHERRADLAGPAPRPGIPRVWEGPGGHASGPGMASAWTFVSRSRRRPGPPPRCAPDLGRPGSGSSASGTGPGGLVDRGVIGETPPRAKICPAPISRETV